MVRSCFGEVGADLSTDILVRANFAKIIVQSISMDLTSLEKGNAAGMVVLRIVPWMWMSMFRNEGFKFWKMWI